MLLFLLGGLVPKVLLLRINDYGKLRLFSLDYFDKLFKVSDLTEILYLLRGNFLVQDVLLLLLPDYVLDVLALTSTHSEVRLETFWEKWCQVWVFCKATWEFG